MQLSKAMRSQKIFFVSFFLLRFVVFPFVTSVNAFVKRKLFLVKNTNVKRSDRKTLAMLLCLKNMQVSATFY